MPTAELSQITNSSARATAKIAVCIATYQRPEGLRRVLRALEKLEFGLSAPPSVHVIVVDNDQSQAAGLRVCEEFSSFRWSLDVLLEERKGISFARNSAVSRALSKGVDAIVFIDDDEDAEPRWLDVLLDVQLRTGAQAVAGPVLSLFEEPPPAWVIKGRFFDRPRYQTGAAVKFVGAGNLLLKAELFTTFGLSFDEHFGLSGGEDTLFSLQLGQKGARIVWADEAVVREWVPRGRTDARYILRRAFAAGNILARAERALSASPGMRAKRLVFAAGGIVQGLVSLLPSIVLGRHSVVRSAMKVSRGVGTLAGLCRSQFHLYE